MPKSAFITIVHSWVCHNTWADLQFQLQPFGSRNATCIFASLRRQQVRSPPVTVFANGSSNLNLMDFWSQLNLDRILITFWLNLQCWSLDQNYKPVRPESSSQKYPARGCSQEKNGKPAPVNLRQRHRVQEARLGDLAASASVPELFGFLNGCSCKPLRSSLSKKQNLTLVNH